jgi:hypothetical protein
MVRPSAADLNVIGMTIDFSTNAEDPTVQRWASRVTGDMPFAILPDRDHGNIVQPALPVDSSSSDQLGSLILTALNCQTNDEYASTAVDWEKLMETTGALGDDPVALAAEFQNGAPSAS